MEKMPNWPNNKSLDQEQKTEKRQNKSEHEPKLEIEFYVTDHSADNPDTGDQENLKELYADLKRDGIKSVRYDWHWRNVEPGPGQYSLEHLERYKQAKQIMEENGLKAPTVILSNPPEWAKKLYGEDKEEFFVKFKEYAEKVKNSLAQAGGGQITKLQILNELNNKVYTPVGVEDLPRLCQITRKVFHDYNPDLKLIGSINVNNLAKLVGTDVKEFLPQLKQIKNNFDIIALDYYTGTWHYPLKDVKKKFKLGPLPTKELFKQLVKQQGLLKETMEEVATWDKEYELGEVGMPSKLPWGKEKSQRYFYDAFFRAFKHLLLDFENRGVKLPSRIGLYEAIDEPPRSLSKKIIRKLTPFPEHDFGLRRAKADGTVAEKKLILQGSPHLPESERKRRQSQLSRIINYINRPIRKNN